MKDSQTNIRLTEDIKVELTKKAKTKGMKISEYIRYLIIKDLEK